MSQTHAPGRQRAAGLNPKGIYFGHESFGFSRLERKPIRSNAVERETDANDRLGHTKNVEAELNFEPSVNAAEIGVAVKDGIVTLTGRVDSYGEKIAAEEAAARVAGVKAGVNELEIRLPSYSKRTDEDIARAVNRLEWTIRVPKDRIKVKVSKEWLTLEGEVDWQFQKNAAERAVRDLVGIT